jgi:hypothetical protein
MLYLEKMLLGLALQDKNARMQYFEPQTNIVRYNE